MIWFWILVTPALMANLLIDLLDTSSFGFFFPLKPKPVTFFCQSVSLYKYKVKTEYKDKVYT